MEPKISCPIIFLVNNPFNGSSTLRAFQISEKLVELGYRSEVYSLRSLAGLKSKPTATTNNNSKGGNPPSQKSKRGKSRNKMIIYDMQDRPKTLHDIKNSIVVILKRAQQSQLSVLRRGGNRLILDPVDYIYYTKYPTLIATLGSYDAIICCNQLMKQDLAKKYRRAERIYVIYHHWDVRLRDRYHAFKQEKDPFGILFSGNVEGVSHDRNILPNNLNCYHLDHFQIKITNNIVDQASLNLPFHYNIRQPGTWNARFKSNIKLSNAAAVGANLITTADQSYGEVFELIGRKISEYPFLTDEKEKNVAEMIGIAEESYVDQGEDAERRWQKGLEMMAEIRKRTDLEEIIQDYLKLFGEI